MLRAYYDSNIGKRIHILLSTLNGRSRFKEIQYVHRKVRCGKIFSINVKSNRYYREIALEPVGNSCLLYPSVSYTREEYNKSDVAKDINIFTTFCGPQYLL